MEQYGIIIHAHITPDESRSYPLSGKSYNDFGFLHLVLLSPEESFWKALDEIYQIYITLHHSDLKN